MNLTIRILGCEVFAVSTDSATDDEPGDALSNPVGFTYTSPPMTAGRYGCDDQEHP